MASPSTRSPLVFAMIGSAMVGAQYIAGKAARDALFLATFDTSALPSMIIGTALFSIALVIVSSRALRRVAPETWVPVAFGLTTAFMIVEWLLSEAEPGLTARILYLQVSGLGPMLGSGFWLIASERFDPHTAKKTFGQIAAAGTIGGLLGGLGAARVSAIGNVGALLPLLAVINLFCAWLLRQLARSGTIDKGPGASAPAREAEPARSGARVMAEVPYLRNLAVLVVLGTIAAVFVDQAFKTQVKAAIGKGPELGSFFSYYYMAVSLLTFALQAGASKFALEKFGLAVATGTSSATFLLGGATTLLLPGLRSIVATRASEAVLRASVYRAGYELFYTPIPPKDKRAVKSIIDVGVDRTGDIVGAAITQRLLWIAQPGQTTVLLSLAMGCSAVALFIASRLKRGYSQALEQSLLGRVVELDLAEAEDLVTKTTILRTQQLSGLSVAGAAAGAARPGSATASPASGPASLEAEIEPILALHAADRDSVRRALKTDTGPSAALVPHVIPLLGRDDVSAAALTALRKVAEERVGVLTDALIDPNQPFAVRRRLPRVLSVCSSQRAVDGLLLGLEDLRFEVRFQCGRSLLSIVEKNPGVHIEPARLYAFVAKEVSVNTEVWEGRRLLDAAADGEERTFLEAAIGERASQSLAHVFTLLALVLPTEPLRVAFRALHTDDQGLRGTALEYLEGVLPREVRDRLWPFVEEKPLAPRAARPRDEALADLMQSNQSILVNLEELKQRATLKRSSS